MKKNFFSTVSLIGLLILWNTMLLSDEGNSSGDEEQSAKDQPVAEVTMTNTLKFDPESVTIHAGETVLWKNTSLLVHTVTADSELVTKIENVALPAGAEPFNSGNIDPEGTFRHRFTMVGSYRYFCILHEGAKMTGEVIVKPLQQKAKTTNKYEEGKK